MSPRCRSGSLPRQSKSASASPCSPPSAARSAVADFWTHGARLAGGPAPNVRIPAAEELRPLEYGRRLPQRQRNVLGDASRSTGRRLFEAALAGGAQAVGSETTGDIVVL